MLVVAALMVFIGLMIKYKKTYWLISGYNTMPKEDQANVDVKGMGNAVAAALFIMGAFTAAGGIFMNFNMDIAGIISLMMILPVALVVAVTSQKYDHNKSRSQNRRESIFMAVGLGFFFTLIITVVFVSLYTGSRPNTYSVNDGVLSVSGMYGKEINISDIKNVELRDSLPGHLFKANGFNLGTVLKGRYHSDSGYMTLYVDTSKPPFIYISTEDGLTILNEENGGKTRELYESLKACVPTR
jgi:hypothetical protein